MQSCARFEVHSYTLKKGAACVSATVDFYRHSPEDYNHNAGHYHG